MTVKIFSYWDKPDLQPIAPFVEAWRSHFPEFAILGDGDIQPILDELFPDYAGLFPRIRIPTCKSDVALLVGLYQFGGLYVDCHCGIRDAAAVKELLTCIGHWDVILYDKRRDREPRPAGELFPLNSVLLATRNSEIIHAALANALQNLAAHCEGEAKHGFGAYDIWALTGPGNLGDTLLMGDALISRLRPEYDGRVRFVAEGPGEPIGRYMYDSYRVPGMHWSERQEHELLFASTAPDQVADDPLTAHAYRAAILAEAAVSGAALRDIDAAIREAGDGDTLARLQTMRIIRASGLFDEGFYLQNNADVRQGGIDALDHYVRHGDEEGRRPNPFFSPQEYEWLAMSETAEQQNSLEHYILKGEALGRSASLEFNARTYLAANPVLAGFVDRPLFHFLRIGQKAGLAAWPADYLPPSHSAREYFMNFMNSERSDLFQLMRLKQALISEFGIAEGFIVYKERLRLPNSSRIALRPVAGLLEVANSRSLAFHEIAPAGEAFTVQPSSVIGEGNHRPLDGITRAMFVTCIGDVVVRARSNVIELDALAVLDFEGDELVRVDEQFQFDPAIFAATEAGLWLVSPEDDAELPELAEAFSLLGVHTASFGHWMCEYLPKYVAAVASGQLPAVPVLIDEEMPQTQRDAVQLMVPEGVPIITVPIFSVLRVRRLWCASAPMYSGIFEKMNEKFRWEYVLAPPARFARIVHEMVARLDNMASAKGQERIFLARKSHLRRKLVNTRDIEAECEARSFRVVYCEELDFIEQVRLVRSAAHIVAPNGSAVYLCLFARPGTKLCVLNHPYTVEFEDLTGILMEIGLNVTMIAGRYVRRDPEYPHFAEYEIEIDHFSKFLREWLGRSQPGPAASPPQQQAKIAAFLGVMDEVELITDTITHLYEIGVDMIVAGDMGSTDGTLEILEGFCRRDDFQLMRPREAGQELIEAWPAARHELLRAHIDWVFFLDADEYLLPSSGHLRECPPWPQVDVLYIDRFNVPLGPNGPVMPDHISPRNYRELLLFAGGERDVRRQLQENPEALWIAGVPAPKTMVRPHRVGAVRDGMHDMVPIGSSDLSTASTSELLIAHVPFSTRARFERKVENVRRDCAASDLRGGEYADGTIAWHWRRWVRLADEGRLAEEFDRTKLDWAAIEDLHRRHVIRSAAEVFIDRLANGWNDNALITEAST